MTEQRIDSAAAAATTTHADEPGSDRGDDGVPATEAERQLLETVKQIHRLEESN